MTSAIAGCATSVRAASPAATAAGGTQTSVLGYPYGESNEFLRQSRTIAEAWGRKGVTARYVEVAGADHFTILDPLSDPASAMTKRLVELARSIG